MTYNSGDTAHLDIGSDYKIWGVFENTTSAVIIHNVSAGGDSLAFNTTNVKFHFSGGYLNYRGSNSWRPFGKDTATGEYLARELFPFDFYGDTMRIQTGYVWNDVRNLEFDIYYKGLTSVEKTLAVLRVWDSKSNPISGATARGGNPNPVTFHVPGSTNANGLLLSMLNGEVHSMAYEAKVNNTTAIEGPKDPTQDSYYLFQTDSVVLRLQTCQGVGLPGGKPRFGNDSTYTTWWFPNNPGIVTDANGNAVGEMFPGTYSFDMQYQHTSDQKIAVNVPSGGTTVTWNTVHVELQHDGAISYGGGTGDATFFNKPSMELLPGTYKFHFRHGNRQDLTLSGCFYTKRTAIVNVLDCNGNNQAGVGVKWYKYGSANNKFDAGTTGSGPYAICIDSGIAKIGVVVNYLGQKNTLVQHLDNDGDTFTFQMIDVALELYNHDSTATLVPDTQQFYVYGNATNKMPFPNSLHKCLLPGQYGFVVNYNQTSQNRNQIDVALHNPVVFQTGLVDDIDNCSYDPTNYYQYGNAANKSSFVDPMEFMPSQVIVESSSNPNKSVLVQAGAIHRLDTCANVEVMDSCVSDSGWSKSTVITPSNWSGWWGGVSELPHDSTFTDVAEVGQPYSWGSITVLPGTLPIKTENKITYFRKQFGLTDTAGLEARFQMYMDDGTEIYINGHLIAREEDMDANNFKGVPHDLLFKDDNTYENGYLSGDQFDFVNTIHLDTILRSDMNNLTVVMRNPGKSGNHGGFSFRMDITKNGQSVLVKKKTSVKVDRLLVAYPNPVQDILIIEPEIMPGAQNEVSVFSMSGQLMVHKQLTSVEDRYEIDLSKMQSGIYFVRFVGGNNVQYAKVIKR